MRGDDESNEGRNDGLHGDPPQAGLSRDRCGGSPTARRSGFTAGVCDKLHIWRGWPKKLRKEFFVAECRAVTPAEFEAQLRDLLRAHAEIVENSGCLACERCERCTDSTFLKDCTNVTRSNYRARCVDRTECSHTKDSKGCFGCSHCERCESCAQSAIRALHRPAAAARTAWLRGPSRKDFHILNEPHERQEGSGSRPNSGRR